MNEDDEDIQTTNTLMQKILLELQQSKARIDALMNESGWDSAFFDVDINLSVKFGKEKVQVREKWRAVEP